MHKKVADLNNLSLDSEAAADIGCNSQRVFKIIWRSSFDCVKRHSSHDFGFWKYCNHWGNMMTVLRQLSMWPIIRQESHLVMSVCYNFITDPSVEQSRDAKFTMLSYPSPMFTCTQIICLFSDWWLNWTEKPYTPPSIRLSLIRIE